jgi:hypothetical protein
MRNLLIASLLATAACGSSSDFDKTQSTPTQVMTALAHSLNVNPMQITVGDTTEYVAVDTGDPEALLDGLFFDAVAAPAFDNGSDVAITLGATTVPDAFVIDSPLTDVSSSFKTVLYGNVGCSVTCGYAASFDYQGVAVALAPTMDQVTAPAGVGADQIVPFTLEGGHSMNLPVSRVIVPVTIDGATYHMMIDTGASTVSVSSAAFAALTADGRATIAGNVSTTQGADMSTRTRAHAITVAGVEVDGAIVESDPNFDTILTNISTDVGYTIDGSLGGTFLRNFFVTIDYPNSQLHLAPYVDTSWQLDLARNAGITITGPAESGYTVTAVTADAAAKGIEVGDNVIAIDGRDALAFDDVYEAQATLLGDVGTTKHVAIGDWLAHRVDNEFDLAVEEQLPLQ